MNDSRGIEERGEEDMAPIGSRLPEDPAYWHTLADQIVTDAVPVLEEYRAKQGIWWSSLAHRSPALAAAAVLAIAAGAFMLVRESAATESSPHDQVARAIGPTDPVARLFLSEGTPPRVESLLAVVSQTAERATEETDR
jgi:hypothetical protein